MKRILIYRNPLCRRCAQFATLHHRLDWFNRIADTTADPMTGRLRMGEFIVEDLATARLRGGASALELIARQVPLYWPLLPLLWLPALRTRLDRMLQRRVDADGRRGRAARSRRNPWFELE